MDADTLLASHAAAVSAQIGHSKRTSTSELRDYGMRNFTPLQFLGVFPANREPPRTRHRSFYIMTTEPSAEAGEHWIAVGREPGRADLVFDSFGRSPGPGWMPHLAGAAVTDTDPNQRVSDANCGQISMGWGHVFTRNGYDVAQLC